jgi:hypothetical protein
MKVILKKNYAFGFKYERKSMPVGKHGNDEQHCQLCIKLVSHLLNSCVIHIDNQTDVKNELTKKDQLAFLIHE